MRACLSFIIEAESESGSVFLGVITAADLPAHLTSHHLVLSPLFVRANININFQIPEIAFLFFFL